MSSLKTHPGKIVRSKSDDNSYITLKGTMLLKTLFCNKKKMPIFTLELQGSLRINCQLGNNEASCKASHIFASRCGHAESMVMS